MRIVGFAQCLFAIASASLALYMLAYGDFAPAGQSLPAWIPWREIWVHGSAVLVLAASAGLFFSRTALVSILTIGVAARPFTADVLSCRAWCWRAWRAR